MHTALETMNHSILHLPLEVGRTNPARHGFPLPLVGVVETDIGTLLVHVPMRETEFNVTLEGGLYTVSRRVFKNPSVEDRAFENGIVVVYYKPFNTDYVSTAQLILKGTRKREPISIIVIAARANLSQQMMIQDTYCAV